MKTFSYSFGAGETKQFPSGKFFILITAGDNVNVTYKKHNTTLDESAQGVQSGYFFEAPDGFDLVEIYSATAQTVKVAISKGGSGGFNISSTVLTGGVIDEVKPTILGETSYNRYSASSAMNTIVTPAANINGIRLTSVTLYNAVSAFSSLLFKTSAPTGFNDGNVIGYSYAYEAGGVQRSHILTVMPVVIPAGYGLYEGSNSASNITAVSLTYDLL